MANNMLLGDWLYFIRRTGRPVVAQRRDLSDYDVREINIRFECNGVTSGSIF